MLMMQSLGGHRTVPRHRPCTREWDRISFADTHLDNPPVQFCNACITDMLCLLMQSQGGAASSAGHVGIAEAQTFAGENGNQISSNDIHLDSPQSNFVIGPDGKVPSLASQVHSPILI